MPTQYGNSTTLYTDTTGPTILAIIALEMLSTPAFLIFSYYFEFSIRSTSSVFVLHINFPLVPNSSYLCTNLVLTYVPT